MAQEQLLKRRRLADETAHTGVTEYPDEFPEALAVDLGAQRAAVHAEVLDPPDPGEITWITDHFGFDRRAAEVTHRVQRAALDGLAGPDDGHPFAQRFRLGQDVAGQQHGRTAVPGLAD